jgi:diphthine-ammonia ligase
MKFVALVSGGKDSCFNILHCLAQGHELVCLANLYPPQQDNDEIDSYMYQTVGHDVLTLYEKCIGKPMYRQPILGNASNQELEYKKIDDNDETEDLFKLLSTVLKKHPDVEGVSVGAILSSYQRTRVEDVCSRLGLTSLAYLWQRNQADLMNEMCQSGMDARIIKVAAIGLDDSNLGMSLQQIHPKLKQLNQMFGVHICGEGGEFETTVLDAPFFEFGRIKIVEKKIVKHTNDDVWYLKMKVEFEPKENQSEIIDWSDFITEPPLLNEKFQNIYDNIKGFDYSTNDEKLLITSNLVCSWKQNVFQTSDKFYISNLSSIKDSIGDQIMDIFEQLKIILKENQLSFENIQSSKLLINDMKNFVDINSIYVKYFTKPLPPSRICVETYLPEKQFAQLSVVVLKKIENKLGLHVQGRSYWAPCNIGPYSQAVSSKEDRVVKISGQIPLIPKSMVLSSHDKALSAVLSLQHYDSIKEVTNYTYNLLTVCFIKNSKLTTLASRVFNEYLSICEDEDRKGTKNLLIVQVTELPKSADVEWGGLAYRKETEYMNYDSDSEDEDENKNDDVFNDKIVVYYVDKLSDFKFNNTTSFYEIYASSEKLQNENSNVLNFLPGYEVFPIVQAFDNNLQANKIAIVESRI